MPGNRNDKQKLVVKTIEKKKMEIKSIPPNHSALSLSGRKISMSKQVKDLTVDQVKDSLLELLEGYEDFVVKFNASFV